jgi:methylmalonyl-CoA/ethylmalonyl-CoA epimerase
MCSFSLGVDFRTPPSQYQTLLPCLAKAMPHGAPSAAKPQLLETQSGVPMPAGSTGLSIDRIRQIAINVHDLDRAKRFYRDVLGMKFLFDAPHLAFFDAGGVRLMLGKAESPDLNHLSSLLYYSVSDIDAAHEALVAHGVKVEEKPSLVAPMPDHDLWISAYRDSEDNIFGLMCEKARGG